MREQFLKTDHGLINVRFIVSLVQQQAGGFAGGWVVFFTRNDGKDRTAGATDQEVMRFLDGPEMPC